MKNEVNNIINKLKKIIDNIDIYYNIISNLNNNYNIKNKNYQLLINRNTIKDFNNIIIKDINLITNEYKIENKFKFLIELYEKMEISKDIIIKYKIEKGQNIRLFGDIFVKNNKDNFKVIIKMLMNYLLF